MQNFSDRTVLKIRGCLSSLVKPPCNGRINLPRGGLVLRLEPETCLNQIEPVVEILPAPHLKLILRALTDAVGELPMASAGSVQSDILSHVRVNLAQLYSEEMTEEALARVLNPYITFIHLQHAIGLKWRLGNVVTLVVPSVAIFSMELFATEFCGLRSRRLLCWPIRRVTQLRQTESSHLPILQTEPNQQTPTSTENGGESRPAVKDSMRRQLGLKKPTAGALN